MQITAHLDFETPPASKQFGRFYVSECIDEHGNTLTHLVKGFLFHSIEQLTRMLNLTSETPILKVNVQVSEREKKGDLN